MTFVLAFVLMLTAVALMALGVMLGRKPIAGSCGGIARLGIDKECSICGGDREKCQELTGEGEGAAVQSYDASRR